MEPVWYPVSTRGPAPRGTVPRCSSGNQRSCCHVTCKSRRGKRKYCLEEAITWDDDVCCLFFVSAREIQSRMRLTACLHGQASTGLTLIPTPDAPLSLGRGKGPRCACLSVCQAGARRVRPAMGSRSLAKRCGTPPRTIKLLEA